MVGLRRGTVRLEPYNSVWPAVFAREQTALEMIFGGAALAIEHVGSTAVPGLSAKPIVDIEVGLRRFDEWQKIVPQLERAGYTFMPERVTPDEIFMPKGPDENRTHYLHVTGYDSAEWRKVLAFRDTLRANEATRQAYENLKQKLALDFADDRAAYSRAKAEFIQRHIFL